MGETDRTQDQRHHRALSAQLAQVEDEIRTLEAALAEKRSLRAKLIEHMLAAASPNTIAKREPSPQSRALNGASAQSTEKPIQPKVPEAAKPTVHADSRVPRAVPAFLKGGYSTDLSAEETEAPPAHPPFAAEPEFTADEKRSLFQTLFLGRKDVYAARCLQFSESGEIAKTAYVPVWQRFSKAVIDDHLCGRAVIGVYPMVEQTRCRFIVLDFDEAEWKRDALAVIKTARELAIPVAPEISRSGKGLHLWLFFSELVPTESARRLGAALLAATIARNGSPRLLSFDRMIPAQDRLREASQIGNLVALPLQLHRRHFNASVFTDDALTPIPRQWAFLASIEKLSREALETKLSELETRLGVPVDRALEQIKTASRHQRAGGKQGAGSNTSLALGENAQLALIAEDYFAFEKTKLTARTTPLQLRVSNVIAISLDALTPALRAHLIRLAAFWNPEYLKRRRELRSTFDTPKKFVLADQMGGMLTLPRGLLGKVIRSLKRNDIPFEIEDKRSLGKPISTEFTATLRPDQAAALEAMLAVENGILVASTGFGKTVLAFALIHALNTSTMVLVHSNEIAKQWVEGAKEFLGLSKKEIGLCRSAVNRQTRIVDIVSPLKLGRMEAEERRAFMSGYGLLIVDECHHAGAGSYVEALEAYDGCRIYGLTATPKRKDGRMPAVRMLIGEPIGRFSGESVDYKIVKTIVSKTVMTCPGNASYVEQVDCLVADASRLRLLREAVESLVLGGRHVLVLTERVEHLGLLGEILADLPAPVFTLESSMSAKTRRAVLDEIDALTETEDDSPLVLLATGSLVGEGFDCPILDALVISLPISWEARLEQYVGRLLRRAPGKTDALVIDIVDDDFPIFRNMWKKRKAGYEKMGFDFEFVAEPKLILASDSSETNQA